MDIFITTVIAFPVGVVVGGVLTALYSRKVVNAVNGVRDDLKKEVQQLAAKVGR